LELAWDWNNCDIVAYNFSYPPKVPVNVVLVLTWKKDAVDVNFVSISPFLLTIELVVLKEVVLKHLLPSNLKICVPPEHWQKELLF